MVVVSPKHLAPQGSGASLSIIGGILFVIIGVSYALLLIGQFPFKNDFVELGLQWGAVLGSIIGGLGLVFRIRTRMMRI